LRVYQSGVLAPASIQPAFLCGALRCASATTIAPVSQHRHPTKQAASSAPRARRTTALLRQQYLSVSSINRKSHGIRAAAALWRKAACTGPTCSLRACARVARSVQQPLFASAHVACSVQQPFFGSAAMSESAGHEPGRSTSAASSEDVFIDAADSMQEDEAVAESTMHKKAAALSSSSEPASASDSFGDAREESITAEARALSLADTGDREAAMVADGMGARQKGPVALSRGDRFDAGSSGVDEVSQDDDLLSAQARQQFSNLAPGSFNVCLTLSCIKGVSPSQHLYFLHFLLLTPLSLPPTPALTHDFAATVFRLLPFTVQNRPKLQENWQKGPVWSMHVSVCFCGCVPIQGDCHSGRAVNEPSRKCTFTLLPAYKWEVSIVSNVCCMSKTSRSDVMYAMLWYREQCVLHVQDQSE